MDTENETKTTTEPKKQKPGTRKKDQKVKVFTVELSGGPLAEPIIQHVAAFEEPAALNKAWAQYGAAVAKKVVKP